MKQIYDKINNHEYLNYHDIARFMYIQTNGRVKTKFLNMDSRMSADLINNYLEVRYDYKKYCLEYFNNDYGDYLELERKKENSSFLVDLYNLYMLNDLFHELSHFQQVKLIDEKMTIKSKLIRKSLIFSNRCFKMYCENHDLYYFEYDALIKAFQQTLYVIASKCKKIDTNAIIEYNRIVSGAILHSYGNTYRHDDVSKMYSKFTSPISYSKFICDKFYDGYDKKRFLLFIQMLEDKSITEYTKIINGVDILEETEKLLYDFCVRNYSTTNILNDIKNMNKKKVKVKIK